MQRFTCRQLCLACLLTSLSSTLLFSYLMSCCFKDNSEFRDHGLSSKDLMIPSDLKRYMSANDRRKVYTYDRNMSLIFVGGVPRSGTTLMRVLLDAHPEIRCGEETRVIPKILGIRNQWSRSSKETERLKEAGLSDRVIDSAVAVFILEIIAKHGEAALRLCNKDPFTMSHSLYLSQLFPSAKFILMIRDGRAVVHSIMTRKVTITGFDYNNYRSCLQRWNKLMSLMHKQCLLLGPSKCLMVYYEKLVLNPKEWMGRILQHLDVPWNESVLHHQQLINVPGGVSLSKTELSTSQVIKPINLNGLNQWQRSIPKDVSRDIEAIAPMLKTLGYQAKIERSGYGAKQGVMKLEAMQNRESLSDRGADLSKIQTENLINKTHEVINQNKLQPLKNLNGEINQNSQKQNTTIDNCNTSVLKMSDNRIKINGDYVIKTGINNGTKNISDALIKASEKTAQKILNHKVSVKDIGLQTSLMEKLMLEKTEITENVDKKNKQS